MTDTESGLLRAVCADKTDDAVRLGYADWLDEQPTVYAKCPVNACGVDAKPGHIRVNSGRKYVWGESREKVCPKCEGRGTAPDDSLKLLAEFIRVQCELAGTRGECDRTFCDGQLVVCPDCRKRKALRKREKVLYAHARQEWQGACQEVISKGAMSDDWITFDRGFVSTLKCDVADWLTHADAIYWSPHCPKCNGDGAVRVPPPASAYQLSATCPECHGSGETTRPFPPTAQPLTDVTFCTTLHLHTGHTIGRNDSDLWLAAVSAPAMPGGKEPISRRLRANDVAAKARELGINDWIVAMCALLWPGIRFKIHGV